jgi:hypothetical protein
VFRPDLSAVAESHGQIVGVWLTTMNEFKVADGLFVAAPDNLVVVDPMHRRKGIGQELHSWARQRAAEDGETTVRFGVTTPENRKRFWARRSSAEPVDDCSLVFTKMISTSPLAEAAGNASADDEQENQGLKEQGLTILIDVLGFPRFVAVVSPTNIHIIDPIQAEPEKIEITIRGGTPSRGYSSLLVSLLTGRLRVTGLWHVRKLLRCRSVLRSFMANLLHEE